MSLLLGAVLVHRAAAAASWSVCIDRTNPTMVMDVRVARAVAETQGISVKLVPFRGVGKGGDGFPPSRFAKMAQSDCQLIMGFPVDAGGANLPANLDATTPYAGTGFVLVRRGGSDDVTLGELPNGTEVGIAQLDTYAGLLFSSHPNIVMHVYPEESTMLGDLDAHHISAGLAWQPSIVHYARMHPRNRAFSMRMLPGKHMSWNLVALYAPRSRAAADSFATGLAQLQRSGRLALLIRPYLIVANGGAAAAKPTTRKQHTRGKKRSEPPALYTAEQASKGAIAYYQNCAMCHGPALDGQEGGYSGPALKGADFADPSYDFHVDEIFNFVAKLMPAATPGSLPPDQDIAIMAFILQQNGYPAGARELIYAEAAKSRVPLRYYGK